MKYAKQKKKSTPLSLTWTAFSKYLRTKECLETTGNPGYGKCCTCGEIKHFTELDAGHFIAGRRLGILFDERGVHIQCAKCNRFQGGRPVEYRDYMLTRYGQEVIDDLYRLAKIPKGYADFELKEMRAKYNKQTRELG